MSENTQTTNTIFIAQRMIVEIRKNHHIWDATHDFINSLEEKLNENKELTYGQYSKLLEVYDQWVLQEDQ